MPAPFSPQEKAIVRFRLTKEQPAGDPRPNKIAGGPMLPGVPAKSVGWEDTELFDLNPTTGDIAEVERQWKEKNGPDSGREWQDAIFPGPEAEAPKPVPPPEPLEVDQQGLRHRAAGQEELPATVTEGVSVPGRGVGFAEGEDHPDEPVFGNDKRTLSQLEGKSDEELLEIEGIGPASVTKIHRARAKRDRATTK